MYDITFTLFLCILYTCFDDIKLEIIINFSYHCPIKWILSAKQPTLMHDAGVRRAAERGKYSKTNEEKYSHCTRNTNRKYE
jgi:hypothetical protein